MTAIQHHKADSYIKNLPNTLKGALIFGADSGLVDERAQNMLQQLVPDVNDPFATNPIAADAILEDPTIVGDAIAAMSLMGDTQVVSLRHLSKEAAKSVADLWDHISDIKGNFLLITMGDVPKTNALRKAFEKDANYATIACYHDDAKDLVSTLRAEFHARNIQADSDAISYIAAHCQGDRMVVRSECEKIALFLGNDTTLTLQDAMQVIGKTTESALEDTTHATMAGNYGALAGHFHKAIQQGVEPIAMIRHLLNYLQRLSVVQDATQKGQTIDAAMKQLRPPVFFKTAPIFRGHAQHWQGKDLWRVMQLLYEAEKTLKSSGVNAPLMASRYLNRIAAIAKQ